MLNESIQLHLVVYSMRKNQMKKENVGNEGICYSFYSSESKTVAQSGIYNYSLIRKTY